MAKQATPTFFDFDFTKFMDPTKFMDMTKDMTKAMDTTKVMDKVMGDLKMDGVMSAHQRNVDTITEANRLALEGARAIMQRQMEIVRQSMEDASSVATQMTGAATPAERMARQTEVMKDVYERSVSNLKELSEMASKSNGEVVDLLNGRFSEAMDEMKAMIEAVPEMPAFPMPAAPAAAKPAAKSNGAATKPTAAKPAAAKAASASSGASAS